MNYFDDTAWQSSPPILSKESLDWLTDKNSLTKRLRNFTQNKIQHHLLFNHWDNSQENWIRKMQWRYKNEIWLYCIVTIPKNSLIDELKNVGTRSIGDILFSEPSLQRSDFLYQEKNGYCSRQSIFTFKQKSFELIETFFPDFFKAISQ